MKPIFVRYQSAFVRASARISLAFLFIFSLVTDVSCQSQSHETAKQDSIAISKIAAAPDSVNADSLATSFANAHPAALRGIVILLDAGHGGSQDGALYDSVAEKNVNLAVAFKLKARLELLGATVRMTRTDDSDLSLQSRVNKSICLKPDIFVSVHSNANRHTSIDGIESYYYGRRSAILASTLLKAISSGLQENANWVKHELLFVLHHNIVPSTLVEIGYLSNTRTNLLLNSSPYQERVAESIARGIFNYFQLKKPARGPLVKAKSKSQAAVKVSLQVSSKVGSKIRKKQ